MPMTVPTQVSASVLGCVMLDYVKIPAQTLAVRKTKSVAMMVSVHQRVPVQQTQTVRRVCVQMVHAPTPLIAKRRLSA